MLENDEPLPANLCNHLLLGDYKGYWECHINPDWLLLYEHLTMLREGKAVDEPVYDYTTCSRLKETKHIEPRQVIILEGIMALVDPSIRAIMDMKVFVDADSDERLIRVLRRDVVERGRTVEDLVDRYQRIIKPMHNLHIEPTKQYADIIVPQGGSNSVAIDLLKQYIKVNSK